MLLREKVDRSKLKEEIKQKIPVRWRHLLYKLSCLATAKNAASLWLIS